jgi:large subunit ribosomal protein L33
MVRGSFLLLQNKKIKESFTMAAGNRIIVTLECTTCKSSGLPGASRYSTMKNKKNTTGRMELKKYCKFERKHTVHKETK